MSFSTLLDDIAADDRYSLASTLDRLTRWAAEVERADNEARQACTNSDVFDAADRSYFANFSHADAIVLLAAVYRAIHESHISLDSRYWVLAGLSDCIGELLPEVQRQLDMKQLEARK